MRHQETTKRPTALCCGQDRALFGALPATGQVSPATAGEYHPRRGWEKRRPSWGLWLWLLALTFFAGDLKAEATPGEASPQRTVRQADGKPLLLAQRRRRRRGGKKKRRRRPRQAKPQKPEPAAEPTPAPTLQPTTPSPEPENLRRGGRVEFDGRLVQGQTAKSGAIYLFARQRTDLKSMVKERENYRKEILRSVLPQWTKNKK